MNNEPQIPNIKRPEGIEDYLARFRAEADKINENGNDYIKKIESNDRSTSFKPIDLNFVTKGDLDNKYQDNVDNTFDRIVHEVNTEELYNSLINNSVRKANEIKESKEYKPIEQIVEQKKLRAKTINLVKIISSLVLVAAVTTAAGVAVKDKLEENKIDNVIEDIIEEKGINEKNFRQYQNNMHFNENLWWYDYNDFIKPLEEKVKSDKDLVYQLGLLYTQLQQVGVDAMENTNNIYRAYKMVHPVILSEDGSLISLPDSYFEFVKNITNLIVKEYDKNLDEGLYQEASQIVEEEGFGGRS